MVDTAVLSLDGSTDWAQHCFWRHDDETCVLHEESPESDASATLLDIDSALLFSQGEIIPEETDDEPLPDAFDRESAEIDRIPLSALVESEKTIARGDHERVQQRLKEFEHI